MASRRSHFAAPPVSSSQEEEDRTEEAMDSMERKYWEGMLDAYSSVYQLTYELAFAISDRSKTNG